MRVVDAQIHLWQPDTPARPWRPEFTVQAPRPWLVDHPPMTAERALAAMDAVGIDGALVTTFPLYDDVEYAREVVAEHPERLRLVTHVPLDQAHPERVAAERVQARPVALRYSFMGAPAQQLGARLDAGEFDGAFAVVAERDLPAMLVVLGRVPLAERPLRRFPTVDFVIDHLGIVQGQPGAIPAAPFADLDVLLTLAKYSNAHVKLSGVPTLSHMPYPYADVWPHVRRVIDAFGAERVVWGSDFSRTAVMHSYADAVGYVRHATELSDGEKELILSGSLKRLLARSR